MDFQSGNIHALLSFGLVGFAEIPTKGGGPGALSSGLANGQTCVDGETGNLYVLMPWTGGVETGVIATPDDPDRKWVCAPLRVT